MIRRSVLIASTAVALTVAGCGGGDDPSPTPTPSPTSTVTPTPSPVSYSSLPLTTAAEVYTVSAATSFTGDASAGPVTLGTAGTDAFSNRVRLALQSSVTSAQTAETVVRENTEESRFTGADLLVVPAPAVTEYVYRESTAPTTAGAFSQLELLNNTISGQVTSDIALALSRVSYAGWWRGASTTGTKRITYGTFGYPTVISDMPTTGTVNYTMRVAGRAVVSPAAGASAVDKLTGTVTLSINYATGLVSLSMDLSRVTAGGNVAYGTFTGTGAIAVGNNQFTGSFGPGSTAGGTFQGLAYGPQAAEMGISFAISGAVAGGDSRAVGVLVGKKS
ncbi:transferrin-binding protein-like solute binding protein [Sphingomonas suaedae]|uniref:Transferrin-binding protein-like solute binding protein n=1 Tax=Sphingomonas suaedae TaxID=2599297 RepID=A0A518RFV0_9SPHN|nr:transferrin-binding protein-like solute binding protein [Sphingomonas suaedae]QDX26316.1 transferrin-binding protein-like solute binding protein [Sphingomonas suaedae]